MKTIKLKDLRKILPFGLVVRIYSQNYEKIIFNDCIGKLDKKWDNFKIIRLLNDRFKDNTFYMKIDLEFLNNENS